MVEKSVEIVHQFARELRPAVLDDLGLIPALQAFMKSFTKQTGVRTSLTAFAGWNNWTRPGARCSFASPRKRSPMWPAMPRPAGWK
jgi:signal transduction histidine kinase